VQGKFNVVADALSRINELPSSELFTGGAKKEDSVAAVVKVVGTVSRSILSSSMASKLQRTHKADTNIRKDLENPEDGRFESSVDGLLYAVYNWRRKLVAPRGKLRKDLMHDAQDALVSGHIGFNKAYERRRQSIT
jgi:hypothetical protein